MCFSHAKCGSLEWPVNIGTDKGDNKQARVTRQMGARCTKIEKSHKTGERLVLPAR